MVVFESAVCTWFIFSSARAAEARLITPTAARPTVHLLNFIWFLRCCLFYWFRFISASALQGKNSFTPAPNGAIEMKIGEFQKYYNIFLQELSCCNMLKSNELRRSRRFQFNFVQ